MKIAVIFVILAVLYCVAADDAKKESPQKENGDKGKGSTPSSSTTASPARARRSPPRFDANQMKGKYAKSNKVKGGLVSDFETERSNRRERSVADYLSPSPILLYAAPPTLPDKFPKKIPPV